MVCMDVQPHSSQGHTPIPQVKCWGSRRFSFGGHWDDDSTTNRGDEPGEMGDNLEYVDLGTGNTVKAITAGGSHTCAILHDDTLKCW